MSQRTELPAKEGPPPAADRPASAAETPRGARPDGSATAGPAPGAGDDRRAPRSSGTDEARGKLDSQTETKSYHLYGTFHNTSFDGARRVEQRVTWATALQRLERGDCEAGTDLRDPVFELACAAWSNQRIIVLRHQQGALDRAELLISCLSHWASGQDTALKLMGIANDVVLPLSDLASDEVWPSDSQGALVLVQRRQDKKTTQFLSSNNGVGVRALQERLKARNSRLLISVAAEWDAGEGRLDPFDKTIRTLEVTASGDRPNAGRTIDDESPFDAVPRIVASLFEGLGVEEYRALVDDLAVGMAPPAVTPPPLAAPTTAGTTAGPAAPPPPAKPTRQQRWSAGDEDRVLAELGVRYMVTPDESSSLAGNGRQSGYCLADPGSPYAESGWVIAHHPSLLGRRADSLLDRYLAEETASARYREAFLGTLARLDSAGVRSVNSPWLMAAWQRGLVRQCDPGWLGERLFTLVEYLSSDSQEAEPLLVTQLIDGLVGDVVAAEVKFQSELGLQPLARVFARGPATPAATAEDFWQRLHAEGATDTAIAALEYRQISALWALLLLARRWPRTVAIALARLLDEVSAAATPWSQASAELPVLPQVPRHGALALYYLIALAASDAQTVWTACATGVVQAFEEAGKTAMADDRARSPAAVRVRAVHGQRLAFLCVYTLSPQIDVDDAGASLLRRLNLLAQTEPRPGSEAGLIGRLLAMAHHVVEEAPMLGPAGAGMLPANDIVRFLRALALELQADEEVKPPQPAQAMASIAAGLCAVLPRSGRRELIEHGRESLDSQQTTRDDFEADDDPEMVRLMRRRIRATQLVLRSLSAG